MSGMMRDVRRTVASATFTAAADRTDDRPVNGDVTYVTFEECDHLMLGNATMTYAVGSKVRCFACGREADEA